MTRLYLPVLAAHVVVAVLWLGSIASVAIAASAARRAGRRLADVSDWLGPLLRYSTISLPAMGMTGGLLDVAARGAFRTQWWFRGSAVLLIATAVLHAFARRALQVGDAGGAPALRRIERLAYGMCALIAVITVLMEVKPF